MEKIGFQKDKIVENDITQKDREILGLFKTKRHKIRKGEQIEQVEQEKEKNPKGRKKKDDNTKREHGKDAHDNIIKKCKRIFLKNLIDYMINFIDEYKFNIKGKIKLQYLNYNFYVNDLKRKNNMDLFDKTLKELASYQISGRYQSKSNGETDWNKNKKIIKIIENDNENINYLLNMTFGEWVNIFTLKKKDKYINFKGLKNTLKEMEEKNEDDKEYKKYFKRFIFYLFNYKLYFYNKKGRN